MHAAFYLFRKSVLRLVRGTVRADYSKHVNISHFGNACPFCVFFSFHIILSAHNYISVNIRYYQIERKNCAKHFYHAIETGQSVFFQRYDIL